MEPASPAAAPRHRRAPVRFEALDLAGAEAAWRGLEAAGALSTPYQRFDFLSAWQRHVGAPSGVDPLIVAGRDASERVAMLLPLGVRRRLGCRTAEFLGGRHANFNAAVWDAEALAASGEAERAALFGFLRTLRPRIDLFALFDQPLSWNGAANPLAGGPAGPAAASARGFGLRPAPHAAWSGRIVPGAKMPRRLAAKERRMAALGAVRYFQPTDEAETAFVLESFLAQKDARQRAAGVPDAFSGDDVRGFLREATRPAAGRPPAIELFAMSVGGAVAAVYGGGRAGEHFSFCFNSIAQGRLAQHSPGLLLFAAVLPLLAGRGVRSVDLGIGEARYKRSFCPDAEPLSDLVLPAGPRGWHAAALLLALQEVKRAVKGSPRLSAGLRAARRLRASIGSAGSRAATETAPALPTAGLRP